MPDGAVKPVLDYHALNAMLNLYDSDGKIRFDADRMAARQYFLQHVNQNTVFFHNLDEKLRYLVDEGYYEAGVLDQYSRNFQRRIWDEAYAHKFRFPTFLGAFKYYTSYTLKTRDGQRYLERYEDRVVMVALTLARGRRGIGPAFHGRDHLGPLPARDAHLPQCRQVLARRTDLLLPPAVEDNMESIGRSINSALQLSKRGGGVALMLTNLREAGAPIKGIENQSSGVIPVMKLLEDSFSYANQLGRASGGRGRLSQRPPPRHPALSRHQARERGREDPHQDAVAGRGDSRCDLRAGEKERRHVSVLAT
jgi:ribonucleoside-diphosphate reductase alpha chain